MDGHSSSEELKGVRERLMKDTQDGEAWTDYGNMLWMEKKPRLAQLAYEKALSLNRTNLLALNNWAVMSLLIAGDAPWDVAAEAKAYWNEALEKDEFYRPAQFNLAILYNYYRLFPQAKILLDQVKVKESSAGVDVSSAVALQGLGKSEQAVSLFQEVRRLDAPKKDFIQHYHAAVREPEECLSHLKQIDLVELQALEKSSYERLKQFCETQKIKGSP